MYQYHSCMIGKGRVFGHSGTKMYCAALVCACTSCGQVIDAVSCAMVVLSRILRCPSCLCVVWLRWRSFFLFLFLW